MNNWFTIKVYSQDWIKKLVKNKSIIWLSNLSSQINGWYSDLKLTINTSIINNEYSLWDYIKIYRWTKLYYTWYIYYINRKITSNLEQIEISLIPASWFIANKNLNYNYIDTASNIIIDLISRINTSFWFNILDSDISNISTTADIINIDIWDKPYLDYFKEVTKLSWINFFINKEAKVYFTIKKDWITHNLTAENNISEINIWETNSNVAKWNNINNSIKLKVNNKYNYRDIEPLDTIKVKNLKYLISDLVVAKVNYWEMEATIELENFNSFTDLIKNIW